MRASEPDRFGEVALVPPTLLFEERLRIDGGDLTLELFLTPGHAADHIAIYIPEIGTLLAGDAAELPFPFVESAATLPQLRDSLARMAALEPRVALYCHAPGVSSPQLLHDNIAYFDKVEQRCRAALAAGAPAPPAEGADLEALVGFRLPRPSRLATTRRSSRASTGVGITTPYAQRWNILWIPELFFEIASHYLEHQ